MFWYLSPKDKCAVCVWPVGCLGRTADWRIREQSAVPMRQSSQMGKPDFPILSIWFMFSILQKSLHSSPFLPNPLCLSAFREVKSGWRTAANSSPLQSPCLSVFRRVWWRVKSISVFSAIFFQIFLRVPIFLRTFAPSLHKNRGTLIAKEIWRKRNIISRNRR